MILILSHSSFDPSTEEVMDWLNRLGARFLRINSDDFDGQADLCLSLVDGVTEFRLDSINGLDLMLPSSGTAEPVRSVWLRRWRSQSRHDGVDLLEPGLAANHKLQYDIKRHLALELSKLDAFFFSRFSGAYWLSKPDTASPNKILVLESASESGLATPATLITTRREDLKRFACKVGPVITKSVSDSQIFHIDGCFHFMYTASLDLSQIDSLPERFPSSLFQERIPKEYELRVFYLEGECYATAIFSQLDPQTRDDFRHYNHDRPNRVVPYDLPQSTAAAIVTLMRRLDLPTGSLDLIHTPDGRDVFLEINPKGQFGMVSKPSNYPLERRIAELLLQRDQYGAA
jgi:ATP-GRASP peptide maturase of grasp-with-spasm system